MSTGFGEVALRERLDPSKHLPAAGSTDRVTVEALVVARSMCGELVMHPDVTGCRPSVLAGTALYVSSLAVDAPRHLTQTQAADLTGTSTVSIWSHLRTVARIMLSSGVADEHAVVDTAVLHRVIAGVSADRVATLRE